MTDLIYKEKCYTLIGLCMEVHKLLGKGFSEAIYKDALEIELQNAGIPYETEKEYEVIYKAEY
jgi:GxxExxY protein